MKLKVSDISQFAGRKLLILGSSDYMLRIIDIAHKNKILAYVTDYYQTTPCKEAADKAFQVDALDTDAVANLIKEESIDGMITGYVDMLLPYYVKICEKVGIPCYATLEQVQTICNKDLFNEKCEEFRIPIPKHYTLEEVEAGKAEYPLAVKPVDNSGSRGFSVCQNIQEVRLAIEEALRFSKVGRVIIQDYLPDGTILLQYYVQNGQPTLFGLSDQYKVEIYRDKSMIGSCEYAPSKYTKLWIEEYNDKFIQMLKSLGIQNAPCEVECWLRDGKIYVGDIGFRMCGGQQEDYYRDATGVFLPEMLMEFALSGKMADCDISKLADPYMHGKRYGHVKITLRPGTIHKIIGYDRLKGDSRILSSKIYYHEGFTILEEDAGTFRQLVSRIFFKCNDNEDFAEVAKELFDAVDFLDDEGKSMKLATDTFSEFCYI